MCGSAGQTHSGPDDQAALAEACARGVEQLGAQVARARDALSRTRDDVELENVVDLGAAAMAGRPDAADAQRPADGQVLKLGHDGRRPPSGESGLRELAPRDSRIDIRVVRADGVNALEAARLDDDSVARLGLAVDGMAVAVHGYGRPWRLA